MLIQWMLAHPIFTIIFIGACVTWTLMTIDDFSKPKPWKNDDW